MTAHNLAIVWGPNLYRTKNPLDDFHMYSADSHSNTLGAVLVLMINHFDLIFGNVLADKFGYNDLVDLDPAQWVVENLETIRVVTNGNDSSSPESAAREATT
ncbi:hypothetical protein EV182_004468 [Spiromyces aspiralis]|uniref:Uncharacterized protein n=1 Tax=Spiromyces aspiralis TaxID=68401 RepID=A0ACC1HV59_9FUNG|nr:hypothetical protein EV182_004468 [Spiromyces aspiralis]